MLGRPTTAWLTRAAFAVTLLTPLCASAQQHDAPAAQALFDQARALIKDKNYAAACPKLLESNRLDPGIGTQFHLADCYEKNGQVASAWATFLDVASIARASNQADRDKVATKRAAALEARLPRLTVNVPEASRVDGLEVKRDGVLVGVAQWSVPVPIDPGSHALSVSAPGRKSLRQSVLLEEGKPATFDVPALQNDESAAAPAVGEPLPVPTLAPPLAQIPPAEPKSVPAPAPEQAKASGGFDALPIALAAAGVVGLGVGTIFGFEARSTNKDSKALCHVDNSNLCSAAGVDKRKDALSQGNIATIGFIAGGALIAASVVVWRVDATSSNNSRAATSGGLRASASILPGNAALYLQGGF